MSRAIRYILMWVVLAGFVAPLVFASDANGRRNTRQPCERNVAKILGSNPCPLPLVGSGGTPESSTLSAAVAPNGAFVRGTIGTTASRESAGIYNVQFPREVANCVWAGTLAQSGNSQPPDDSVVRLIAGAAPNIITAIATGPTGNSLDSPVHVIVTC